MQTEIRKMHDEALLKKTRELAQEERRITALVLRHLREVERRKLFASLGYGSLFEYAVKELGYAESSAQRRISSMRLLREIPEIEEKIEDGRLSLSVISQAQTFFRHEPALTLEDKKEVLSVLEGKSTREAERELLARSSQPAAMMMPERVRPVNETHSEVRFIADEKLIEDLEKIRGLLAHSHPNMTMAELIQEMARITLEKIDPAREPSGKKESSSVSLPAPAVAPENRRCIPAALKRQVWRRDQGRCSYRDSKMGRSCNSRYALQTDHIVPYALGGETALENLRLLCANHNQKAAIRSFGLAKTNR